MASSRSPASLRPAQPADGGVSAAPGAVVELRARRFLLLLLGMNGAVMALTFGAGALVPAAEAAGHVGGDFIAWCSTLR